MAYTWPACPFKCRANSTVEFSILDSDMQIVGSTGSAHILPAISHQASAALACSVLQELML